MYLLTWLPHEVGWEARATCFARPALVCCPGQVQVQSWGVSRRARVMRVTIGARGWGLEKSIVSFCGSIFGVAFFFFVCCNRAQSLHHDILLSRCDVSRAPTLNRLHSTTRRGPDALCHCLHSALRSPSLPHFSFAIPLFFCVVPPTPPPLFIHFFVCWHLVVVVVGVASFYF